MNSERERRYGAWGNINEKGAVVILPGKEKNFSIYTKIPIWRDRYGHIFFRKPNPFMKAEIVYQVETSDIKDLIIDLERAGFEFEPYS